MDPRRLSPIDHIDHVLLDTFIQKSLPDVLAPLQATLVKRMPHPCRLVILWLDESQTEVITRIDSHGHCDKPGEHDPRHIDDSPVLSQCLAQGTPAHRPPKDDPILTWVAGDTCQPLPALWLTLSEFLPSLT